MELSTQIWWFSETQILGIWQLENLKNKFVLPLSKKKLLMWWNFAFKKTPLEHRCSSEFIFWELHGKLAMVWTGVVRYPFLREIVAPDTHFNKEFVKPPTKVIYNFSILWEPPNMVFLELFPNMVRFRFRGLWFLKTR